MMLALSGADRAQRIADMVPAIAAEIADNEYPGDWSDARSQADYVTMLRGMQAWVEGPKWDRVVVVEPRMQPSHGAWSGTPAAILDQAADRVDVAAGDEFTFRHGRIEQGDGAFQARLVCERKPNLERAGWTLWLDSAPMIEVTLDGRAYRLGWDLQDTAVTVANRYPFRHGHGARIFAHDLLLLARSLGVDTLTALRITDIVVPDRCQVAHERNTALRILSAEEELHARDQRPPVVSAPVVCPECGALPGERCLVGCQGQWV